LTGVALAAVMGEGVERGLMISFFYGGCLGLRNQLDTELLLLLDAGLNFLLF